jgi:hypothetical protein
VNVTSPADDKLLVGSCERSDAADHGGVTIANGERPGRSLGLIRLRGKERILGGI